MLVRYITLLGLFFYCALIQTKYILMSPPDRISLVSVVTAVDLIGVTKDGIVNEINTLMTKKIILEMRLDSMKVRLH